MATIGLALGEPQGTECARARVVNDFSISVATVNGSGSQSANNVLLKSIFGMGRTSFPPTLPDFQPGF
jgi:2-oxoglutarate ferredoxin oxidoreductase subunit alpha